MSGVVGVRAGALDHIVTDAPTRRQPATLAAASIECDRMKLAIVGGGVPRPARIRRPVAAGGGLGLAEVVLHDIDEARLERIGTSRWAAAEHGQLPFCRRRTRRRRGGRGLRVLRDPRRAARGPRGRRGRAARAGRPRTGDDRSGRHLLRAAHDPGDGAAGGDDRPARAARLADQLHQSGGDGDRGEPAGPRRPRGRHLRLAVGHVPARGRGDRARAGGAVVRLLRAQPSRLAEGRARRHRHPARRPARGRRRAGRLRGGRLFGESGCARSR